jgi:hypothetical protein
MTVDYDKVRRQLQAAQNVLENVNKKAMVQRMFAVYGLLAKGQTEAARQELIKFERIATDAFGWPGDGAELPPPFNKRHMERIYLAAYMMVGRRAPAARRGKPKEIDRYH